MDKLRQKKLFTWLRQQQTSIRQYLAINIILGAISTMILVVQVALLAQVLDQIIIQQTGKYNLALPLLCLLLCFALRAFLVWLREKIGFLCGKKLRHHIRGQIFQKLEQVGPATINQRPAGSWASIMLEQVENLHNFYARFMPQQMLAMIVPLIILIAIFPLNWAAALILLGTAPLIPIFMILVGIAAADRSQKNMEALSRLSAQFLDRLRGIETLRLFNRAKQQVEHLKNSSETLRLTTMEVLKLAFLSSAVLEFFTSISIALMAVYFGFSYLGEFEFGNYGTPLVLFTGFFCLILAPEFYQPLRDLGTFYHDRSSAIGAADAIVSFLEEDFLTATQMEQGIKTIRHGDGLTIQATDLVILSAQGKALSQPLCFSISTQSYTAIVGQSGAGKSSLINVILGFLPYQGSLKINGIELRELDITHWRKQIAWVGQNPLLLQGTLKQNLLLGDVYATDSEINHALSLAHAKEFTDQYGLDMSIQEGGIGLSVGQAQRIAVARALLRESQLLLLDEPTASLDAKSEEMVLHALQEISVHQTTLVVTHRIEDLQRCDQIFVMQDGQLIQQGTFDQLKQQGFFAELLKQRAEEVN